MVDTLTTSNFNFSFQESVYYGKVRDVYYLKNNLVVMVASDRISAFDVVMPRGIPYKGQILNQIAMNLVYTQVIHRLNQEMIQMIHQIFLCHHHKKMQQVYLV